MITCEIHRYDVNCQISTEFPVIQIFFNIVSSTYGRHDRNLLEYIIT